MGLRCSLLGHDFGDPEVEREREERGSEVVLTVREVAECGRCSQTKVVSENKEVTTLHDESDGAEHDAASDAADSDVEFVDAEVEDERDAQPASDADDSSTDDAQEDAPEEDAVIMDDEEDDGRAHGEWPEPDEPDEDDADAGEPAAWPTVESDDEGFDAQPSAGGDAAVEFGGGLAPERTTVEEEEGLEYVESAEPPAPGDAGGDSPADDGFAKAGAAPVPADPDTPDVDAEFVCPQCGFVDDVVGSSLRAGDVCPDCRKGYLAERRA